MYIYICIYIYMHGFIGIMGALVFRIDFSKGLGLGVSLQFKDLDRGS